MTAKQRKIAYLVLAFCAAAFLASATASHTTDLPIIKDARQNVYSAYHVAHGDGFSIDGKHPSMRREPLPIIAIAVLFLTHPDFAGPYTADDLTTGRLNPSVKKINAFWRFLAAFSVFLLCWELFPGVFLPAAASLICIAISDAVFFSQPAIVDRLYTELPASAFLLIASWCAVRFSRRPGLLRALFLGTALGALALTKAAFFYVSVAFITLLFFMDLVKQMRAPQHSWRWFAGVYIVTVLALVGTIAPWVIRNQIQFGDAQIASRGELVLAVRVLLTEQPLLGGLYAFSPGKLKSLVGPLTGYTGSDLKPGGRLHDLYTAKSRRNETFKQRMEADGFKGDQNDWFRHMALTYIAEHPARYIGSIGVFAYKGMWFMKSEGAYFNIAAMLGFLGVFFWALCTGNGILVAAYGLSFGGYLFISVFSHALTRYNAPITPLVLIADLWLAMVILQAIRRSPRLHNVKERISRTFYGTDDKRSNQLRPATDTSSLDTSS